MHTVDIHLKCLPHPGPRGYRYECHLSGAHLVTSHNPEYAACRKLLALGHTGKARFFRGEQHASSLDIERGARRTISENSKHGPKVTKYHEFTLHD